MAKLLLESIVSTFVDSYFQIYHHHSFSKLKHICRKYKDFLNLSIFSLKSVMRINWNPIYFQFSKMSTPAHYYPSIYSALWSTKAEPMLTLHNKTKFIVFLCVRSMYFNIYIIAEIITFNIMTLFSLSATKSILYFTQPFPRIF